MATENEEFGSRTEVENIIRELKEGNVNFENYKAFTGKIDNTSRLISAQIESLSRELKSSEEDLADETSTKHFERAVVEKFIPLSVHKIGERIINIRKQAYSWKALELQMYRIIFTKISQVLDDAKALDIKRDALREMKEMETARNELFLRIMTDNNKMIEDVVNNKLSAIDEKIMNSVKFVAKEIVADKKETLTLFSNILKDVNIDKTDFIKSMKKNMEDKTVDEEILKPVGKIHYEKTKASPGRPKKVKAEDSDPFLDEEEDVDSDDEVVDDDDYVFGGDSQ